ncbi:MAG: hypothetical protein IJP33_04920 [Firmicutes bacterium]|nr:hypothetical protein [Bacillota bacterium]
MQNRKLILAVFPLITIFLEMLPYGAVLNFARPATDGSIGHFRETFSYFSLTPFGYANFGPLLTAILSCLMLVLIAVYIFSAKASFKKAACITGIIAALTSLMPLIMGLRYISAVGLLITASLFFGTALLYMFKQ